MQSIQVTFPVGIAPSVIITKLEGALKRKTTYTCTVEFLFFDEKENIYLVSSEGGAPAFYCIGMTASIILSSIDILKTKKT